MINNVLYLLLIGHFLGDYYFQSNKQAKIKDKSIKSLSIHSVIYCFFIISPLLFVFGLHLIKYTLMIALIHFIVDYIKGYAKTNINSLKNKEVTLY